MSKSLHLSLVFLRLLILLTSTSFIHPDEHFQSTQIAIPDLFSSHSQVVNRTWEWDPNRLAGPLRSIIPVTLTTHLPLAVLKLAHSQTVTSLPSTYSLIIAPRLWLLLFSLLPDYLLLRHRLFDAALLFASSPATLVFLTRPFSNSFEALLFVPVFFLSLAILRRASPIRLSLWTFLNVMAVWSRVTFIAFGLPGALLMGWTRILFSPRALLICLFTAFSTLAVLLLIDSTYSGRWPTIPPVALLMYNLDPQNLALHGLHPRWLHLLVNGPLLFGPALWTSTAYGIWTYRKSHTSAVFKLSAAVLVTALAILSTQPHQEPRFLMPLCLPLSIIAGQTLTTPTLRKRFWTIHLTHSLLATIFYAFLHQAGLFPALSFIQNLGPTEIVSWKTFDIPTALVDRPAHDLGSANPARVHAALCAGPRLLIAPLSSPDLLKNVTLDLEWTYTGFHVDPDHIFERGLAVWRVVDCDAPTID